MCNCKKGSKVKNVYDKNHITLELLQTEIFPKYPAVEVDFIKKGLPSLIIIFQSGKIIFDYL